MAIKSLERLDAVESEVADMGRATALLSGVLSELGRTVSKLLGVEMAQVNVNVEIGHLFRDIHSRLRDVVEKVEKHASRLDAQRKLIDLNDGINLEIVNTLAKGIVALGERVAALERPAKSVQFVGAGGQPITFQCTFFNYDLYDQICHS